MNGIAAILALDELLELVEQLPELPLTPDEEVKAWVLDELLQLYAFAEFGVALKIMNNAATEMVMPNAKPSLIM